MGAWVDVGEGVWRKVYRWNGRPGKRTTGQKEQSYMKVAKWSKRLDKATP